MFKRAVQVVKRNWKLYLVCNAAFYGTVLLGMLISAYLPEVQQVTGTAVVGVFEDGHGGKVAAAYWRQSVPLAALYTFAFNFFVATLLTLTLPSLFCPPLAVLIVLLRALLIGVVLSPTTPELRLLMIFHTVTLVVEGQAYVLAVFAGLTAWLGWFSPRRHGVTGRLAGLWRGVREAARVYLLVLVTLGAAAAYEAITLIAMLRFLGPGPPP